MSDPTRPRLLFHVQSLLGIGHLRRAAAIARALHRRGFSVIVANGGAPIEGLDFGGAVVHQLPVARAAGGDFSSLVDETGRPLDDAWRSRRCAETLALIDSVVPDILLLEMYPFGRRAFAFELDAAMERAKRVNPYCKIAVSVRDVLVAPSKPIRHTEAAELVHARVDRVLVHGSPDFIPFEASFAPAARIAPKVTYTGFVADAHFSPTGRSNQPDDRAQGPVVVSAGGGAVGGPLMRAAMNAARDGAAGARMWRFLVGPNLPSADRDQLVGAATARLVVEPNRPDFQNLLSQSCLSISNAGYNTILDLLLTRTPAILIPFAAGGRETEQPMRAARLADLGCALVISEEALDAASLGQVVARMIDLRYGSGEIGWDWPAFPMDGAARSAESLWKLYQER